jgi:hypothetical protein
MSRVVIEVSFVYQDRLIPAEEDAATQVLGIVIVQFTQGHIKFATLQVESTTLVAYSMVKLDPFQLSV